MRIGRPALLLFGSGFAALVYQTAWQRMLRLVFGASTGASAAVLAIFLGGLGIGGLWLGKRAERHARPLMFYAQLEAGAALLAATTPWLVDGVRRLYFALGGAEVLGLAGATVIRLLLSALVMGPALLLMGGTLPAAVRAVEEEGDAARSRLAVLYGANTTGAVTGALLSTFLLFELFGTRLTLWIAALVNLLVAILARSLARHLPPVEVTEAQPDKARSSATSGSLVPSWLVYLSAGLVGFVFIGLELVWYRALAPLLGGSSFMFGLVLAVALAGIGLGGFLYSRRDPASPATLGLLSTTVVLEALAIGLPFAFSDELALVAAYTRPMAAMGFGALVTSWTVVTLAVVFVPALVSGYQFPALVALLGRGRTGVARHVALAYASNTAGAIVGALATGFVLIPTIGTVTTWRALVALLAGLGLGVLAVELYRSRAHVLTSTLRTIGVAAAAIACVAGTGPSAVSRHVAIGAGRVSIHQYDRNMLRAWMTSQQQAVLWEKDGVESNVAINRVNCLSLLVNGKSDGNVYGDRGTQVFLGLLPALIHPAAKHVFVLGLGTGMTAGWLSAVPGMERVDVAELEPAVLEMARLGSASNQDVLRRPNVTITFGDGREQLMTTRRRYDIISSEPSNPYRAGVASLYTTEFYRAANERLNPGGVFAQWVQAYEVDVSTLRIVLRTIQTVFSDLEIWQTQTGDLLLIAGHAPRTIDVDRLRARIRTEPFRTALPRAWLVEDAEGVLAHFLASNRVARALSQAFDPALNTDDDTVLEFAFARQVGHDTEHVDAQLWDYAIQLREARPRVSGRVDWSRVAEEAPRAWLLSSQTVLEDPPEIDHAWQRARAIRHICRDEPELALAAWSAQPRQEPLDALERLALARGYAATKNDQALPLIERLERAGYKAEAALARGQYQAALGEPRRATDALVQALTALRSEALPLCGTALAVLHLLDRVVRGKPDLMRMAALALMQGPLVDLAADEDRQSLAQELAFALPDGNLCLRALGERLLHPRWDKRFLAGRWQCLVRTGHPLASAAERDLGAFLAGTAGRVDAGVELRSPAAPTAASSSVH